jgi:hypothetical protein
MAQTNYTPISLYYSTTASAVPTAANLVPGELAINTNDGKLYYEDSSGVVQVLATKSTGSIGGSNTQVQFNNSGSLGGSSSFTWDGTTVTATKFAGALNGTVGATTASTGAFTTINASTSITNAGLTSGRVTFAGASGLLSDSASLTFDGTTLSTVGITTTGNTILGNASSDTLNVGNGDLIKDASGNLGVGVTPSAWDGAFKALQIGAQSALSYASSATYLSTNYYRGTNFKYLTSNYATDYYQSLGAHVWRTAASGTAGNDITFTQAMTLNASGNLLVGTTSALSQPARTTIVTAGGNALVTQCANGTAAFQSTNASGTDLYYAAIFSNNGNTFSTCGVITVSGTTTSYVTSSDYRLKENVVPMTGALSKVAQLKPVTYKWKSNGTDGEGFIAHELAEICPQAVVGEKDGLKADGSIMPQGIDTSFLVATLTKAIQEQQALIESLTTRLTALENK